MRSLTRFTIDKQTHNGTLGQVAHCQLSAMCETGKQAAAVYQVTNWIHVGLRRFQIVSSCSLHQAQTVSRQCVGASQAFKHRFAPSITLNDCCKWLLGIPDADAHG